MRMLTWVILTVIVLFLLASLGLALPVDFAIAVLFGWAFYLWRVVPEVTIGWDGVATAAICLVLFLAGSHAFLGWLYGEVRKPGEAEESAPRRWRVRWTLSLGVLVVLMFVAGTAAAGIVHQVGWLLTAREPLIESGGGARSAARRAQSTNNLKQIGLGLHNYQSTYSALPPGGTFDAVGRPLHGWQARLLPYIEQKDLHDRIDFNIPWDDPRNAPAFRTELFAYLNPGFLEQTRDGSGYALSHYAGNAYLLGGDAIHSLRDIKDGTSNTIMAGEVAGEFRPWGDPTNWRDPSLGINRSPRGFGGPFAGGATVLFADGSVHFIKNAIDPRVLRSLGTPAGGETISADQY